MSDKPAFPAFVRIVACDGRSAEVYWTLWPHDSSGTAATNGESVNDDRSRFRDTFERVAYDAGHGNDGGQDASVRICV